MLMTKRKHLKAAWQWPVLGSPWGGITCLLMQKAPERQAKIVFLFKFCCNVVLLKGTQASGWIVLNLRTSVPTSTCAWRLPLGRMQLTWVMSSQQKNIRSLETFYKHFYLIGFELKTWTNVEIVMVVRFFLPYFFHISECLAPDWQEAVFVLPREEYTLVFCCSGSACTVIHDCSAPFGTDLYVYNCNYTQNSQWLEV